MKLLGISGSLRRGSMNTGLLRAIAELAPDHVEIEIFDASDVPLFNADVEEQGDPGGVVRLKAAITGADGVILAAPEYNSGLTAVMKNLIDWASRGEAPIKGKPTGIIGASGGRYGTARAQIILRGILIHMGCPVLPSPAVALPNARGLFTDGELTDEAALARLERFLVAFEAWVSATGRSVSQ